MGLDGVTDRSRSTEEACGTSLARGRQTSVLSNVSPMQVMKLWYWKGSDHEEGNLLQPHKGAASHYLLPFLAFLIVKAVSTLRLNWLPLVCSHWS